MIWLPQDSSLWLLGIIMIRKKRRNLYLLPSYSLRLLALPINSRTATQKPTLIYAKATYGADSSRSATPMATITYPRASTVA